MEAIKADLVSRHNNILNTICGEDSVTEPVTRFTNILEEIFGRKYKRCVKLKCTVFKEKYKGANEGDKPWFTDKCRKVFTKSH